MVSYNSVLDVEFSDGAITEPVTLEEVKNFCKIDISNDDELLTAIITAARHQCEAYTNTGFVLRDITAVVNNENGGIYFPYGPLVEIYSVTDKDGKTLILDDNYETKGVSFVRLIEPKETDIVLDYAAGYEELPQVLKLALLNAIYWLYDNRAQGADNIGPIAKSLLNPYKRV